jgi:hypothetical protein
MASNFSQTQMLMSKKEDKSRRGRSSQPTIQPTSVLSSIRNDMSRQRRSSQPTMKSSAYTVSLSVNPKPIIPDEKTIEIITRVFSPKIIEINSKININIIDSESDDICGLFVIYPDHIHIKVLHKCGTTTGNNLLEKFDLLAQQIPNMTYIKLDDESNIKLCGHPIQLYTLKILTTGESWYNKYGYVSDDMKYEIPNNKKIINMPYEEFRDMIYAERLKRNDDKEQLEAELDTGIRLFPETKKTVQDYFIYVMDDINKNIEENGCDDAETKAKCRWLSKFILHITISSNLRYKQISLFKEMGLAGLKPKRNKSKRNKSKKIKSKRNKSKISKSKRNKKY